MSAEEWIYDTYGGVNSDDFSDFQDVPGDCTLEAHGDSNNYNRKGVSKPTHTHNPNNKKLPYIANHKFNFTNEESK